MDRERRDRSRLTDQPTPRVDQGRQTTDERWTERVMSTSTSTHTIRGPNGNMAGSRRFYFRIGEPGTFVGIRSMGTQIL
jgi:hypothetical protein